MTDLTTTLTQWNKFKPKTLRSYVREIALDMLSLKNKFIDIENVLKKPEFNSFIFTMFLMMK